MRHRKQLIAVSLGVFVLAALVGAFWPSSAAAAPLCDWCDGGELRCISRCYSNYPNDPIAQSQCIDDCFESWLWCYEICI
jgi:hypothetical protein